MSNSSHVLTIVIPALNEEEAIGGTIRRCLDARSRIIESSGVNEVEVIVVSDGSTDRTEEIAQSFDEVTVLVFEENRGYGAAIKCGFAHGRGDLVSFIDADGTCDPRFFADMCRAIDEEEADLVLGSRVGTDSEMPWIRTVGNQIFAWILGVVSRRSVGDTASGMRVIRRSCLRDLEPLPDGLHYTPAMSARALLEGKLRLVELPMSYAERMGQSKLSVVRDGVRFLKVIIHAATAFRPSRPLLIGCLILALAAITVGFVPARMWLEQARLEEWMIYRILLASLLVTVLVILICSAVVADRIAALAHGRPSAQRGVTGFLTRLFTRRNRFYGGLVLVGAAVAIVSPGIVQYLGSGHVEMHWSRVVLASLLVVMAAMLGVTTFLLHMLELIMEQRGEAPSVRPPERIHRPRTST
jgi:glycosyltransferase involved in cell wall biosynthesis